MAARPKPGKKASVARKKPAPRKKKPATRKTYSRRVEVPGVRPAAFKLVEKGVESFDLFRSSGRLGTARVEERGQWAARFAFDGKDWKARADSAEALLQRIGTFILATEAHEAAAEPVEKTLKVKAKSRLTAEEKFSLEWARRAQDVRLEKLNALIAECARSISASKR